MSYILFDPPSKTLLNDKSKGRVQILDGRLFYSPNSNRTVTLPVPLPDGRNPFIPDRPIYDATNQRKYNYWELDVSTYEQPQWWHHSFGWIAFYDSNVLSSSLPKNILHYSKSQFIFDEDAGYVLSSSQKDDWLRLDNQLNGAYQLLMSYYPATAIAACSPWVLGYLRPHKKSQRILGVCLEKSRQWFGVWMALLSFCIASAETIHTKHLNYPLLAKPAWQSVLIENGKDVNIDCAWIDMLLATFIALFSSNIQRAGTFVHLAYEEKRIEPPIEWLMGYHVPVWYEWIPKNASQYERFAPLTHQLQEALSFRTKSPVPLPAHPILSSEASAGHVTPPTPGHDPQLPPILTTYMEEFFRLRDERIKRNLEHETPQQRSLRLSRQKQHPTPNARVFEWRRSPSGEYRYEEIPKKERTYILDFYSGDQSHYDPVLNEWHCCDLWGW